MSDYLLPEEILIEILVKLPAKSLIRFTSVCKEWRSLIRTPSFISTHLSNTENQALVGRYDTKDHQEHCIVIPERGPLVINSASELEFPIGYNRIVGSCNGLVCLCLSYDHKHNSKGTIIWNPAIRNQLVVLPQPLLPLLQLVDHEFLGFGVANNVYKVVRLVYCQNADALRGFIGPPQAEIFYLGTGWRKLNGVNDARGLIPQFPWHPIFFKGFVHWIAYDPIGGKKRERNSILRFHVGDEVFDETMLPQELVEFEQPHWVTCVTLYMMGGKLGACKYDNWDNLKLDVWMMKDYGVKESWTKLYSIDSLRFDRAIGFWGSCEALLDLNRGELVTYNNEKLNYTKHVWDFVDSMSFYVGDFKESLVLLGSEDIVEIRARR